MNRPFTQADNGRRFRYGDYEGTLEYPLTDPGSALPGEGILWITDQGDVSWLYADPAHVEPVED